MTEIYCNEISNDFNETTDTLVINIKQMLEEHINKFNKCEDYILKKVDIINQQRAELDKSKVNVQNAIEEAKIQRDHLKIEYESKMKESTELEKNNKSLEDKYKVLVNEYENLEKKCLELKSKLDLSPHDKLTLEIDKKKLDLYGEATNIVWDYSLPINLIVSGCVRNKSNSYLQSFVYKKDEVPSKEITTQLWEQIELGLQSTWDDIGINSENNKNISNKLEK